MNSPPIIGQRIDWLQDILDRAADCEEAQEIGLGIFDFAHGKHSNILTENDLNFLDNIRDKVNQYKSRTFISTAQINWLNDIEQRLRDAGFAK